ncbi:MAG TPA: ferritin-like domain-containing protein, partial [Streptosporangiaceae bacterium]|nr:ferritin-like domain-containing protein [Streptosporangiaceae bacterium]
MGNDQDAAAAGLPAAGQGRLAQVIATRGGLAAPEAPFVIEHREALIYMLCEAAELEHGIMCQYLFAAFSLKQGEQEGLSGTELDAVRRWRKQVSHVAAQEMLHLALVHNLLSAIGAAPHMARPNLPAPASHYPAGVQLALLPFGEQALRHFMFLERPEGMDLADADGLAAIGRAAPMLNERDIVPRGQDFATVGHLYRSIEAGFAHLAEIRGEDWLFVGPPRAQATAAYFGWPELVAVTDLASAQRAIEEILEQGEGPRGHWRDAHFGQFVNILDEYQRLREANPGFDPVRPVLAANVRPPERDVDVPLIGDPLTARVTDLFNVGYEVLLQIFERFFAHTEETDAELKALADATVAIMLRVIKPLGDLITTLPVGEDHPGMTAGPSFELFYESDYLMPHREAAWALLAERLDEAAWLCDELQAGRGQRIAGQLDPVLAAMREVSQALAAHLPAGSAHARLAGPAPRLERAELGALLDRAAGLAGAVTGRGGTAGPGRELYQLFGAAHAVVTQAAAGLGCGAGEQALIVPRLVGSVLRPLADALGTAPDGPAGTTAPGRAGEDGSPDQPGPASPAGRVWEVARMATALRARLGRAGSCPPELAEAAAALQDLAVRLAAPGEAAARLDELWELQSGLPASVQPERNGPYLVTNVPRLIDHLGAETRPAPQLALCRCGNSSIKPLCDGSHASSGFTDAKDPKRVPDRRDTYDGQQLTIYDNRGICQHSGLCTDRLPNVFRTSGEPFVAASGGRMDEIIRAVRDCPSGALSYAIDGTEARGQADWGGTREPAVEVTKDGPYRITGGISLAGADGAPEPRAQGASLEHYALCRCGQSQNKPFCSGMHWYVGFRDPVPAPGYEPAPFEWAGGRPALTRMSRLLYERHVPLDPLLAPLFADMPPDQPRQLATWLAGALGGPPAPDGGEFRPSVIGPSAGQFTEEQRARWAALAGAAADEAGLPADPAFRSAFTACVDWASRTALAQPGAGRPPVPAPRWGWGPGGPPAAGDADQEAGQADEPAELPGPDQQVGFAAHIKPLFRESDRKSMSFAFDLWSADDVRGHATG